MIKDSERGGMLLRMVMLLVTLVIMGSAIFWMLHTHQLRQKSEYRKAVEIAEYGLLQALQELQEHPAWLAGYLDTPYNEGHFSVTVKPQVVDDSIAQLCVESTGRLGSATHKRTCLLARVIQNTDTVWQQVDLR